MKELSANEKELVRRVRGNKHTKEWIEDGQFTDAQVAALFWDPFNRGWARVHTAQTAIGRVQWIIRDRVATKWDIKNAVPPDGDVFPAG